MLLHNPWRQCERKKSGEGERKKEKPTTEAEPHLGLQTQK